MITAPRPRYSRLSQDILVELATTKGTVFSGTVSAVEFSPSKNLVQLEPNKVAYIGVIDSGELAVRIGKHYRFFRLVNASASFHGRRITVIAETIQPTATSVRDRTKLSQIN
jgi:hypothetical protein